MTDDIAPPALTFHREMTMGFQHDWSFASEDEAEDFWTMQDACDEMRLVSQKMDRL